MKFRSKTLKTGQIEKRLNRILGLALKRLGTRHRTADVFLVGDGYLRKLQAKYYKKGRSRRASVLAFPESTDFPRPESKKIFLGEIYLNKGLASDLGRLEFLLIHGLLHLLGYSHDKNRDTLKMEFLEKKLIREISKKI